MDHKVQDLLLQQLHRDRYKTIGDLDRAIEVASEAVEAYSRTSPEMFDAGTDYITKSLGFMDQDFRVRHGFAPKTRAAFHTYGHLVRGT